MKCLTLKRDWSPGCLVIHPVDFVELCFSSLSRKDLELARLTLPLGEAVS